MKKLKELRKKENKTQEEIATNVGIEKRNYQNYELGIRKPTLETLIKIANYFNVSLDYIVERDFNNDIGYITNDEKELITDYRKLNQINKIKILAELKGFLIAQNWYKGIKAYEKNI